MANSDKTNRADRMIFDLLSDHVVPELSSRMEPDLKRVNTTYEAKVNLFTQADIFDFSKHLGGNSSTRAIEVLDDHLRTGINASQLVLELLTASACHLGEQWCSDEKSFAEVTIGLSVLHQTLRHLDTALSRELMDIGRGRNIIFATMPDDTHIFGVSVLEAIFRNSGWMVETKFDCPAKKLIKTVSSQSFDAIGLSISHSRDLVACRQIARQIRSQSLNPHIKLLAGGSLLSRANITHRELGVDAIASGAIEALEIASVICSGGSRGRAVHEHSPTRVDAL